MPCRYCGKVIRCNMYRHVARLHLDLAQLWRCPVSWCTVWRGSPQDCMEHLRNGHDVPWISKTASIERFVPPWTVRQEVWTESMRLEHSGISTDILLFSELGFADTPLQGLPRRVATLRLSIGLHDEAPCPLADAMEYDRGNNVATGNRTRGDTQICEAVASAFPTGALDVGGGWRTTVTNHPESG